jgi:hypothetical protein
VSGPCAGQSLTPCPLRIDNGGVFLVSR